KPPLLELVLDRLPFFGVPGEAPAKLLRKLGGSLLGLLRERRPAGSPLWHHLAVPPSPEIAPHDRELDLLPQRLEVSGALRLARRNLALADEALPRAVGQQGQLADALVLLEVGENLLDDLQLLLDRDARRESGGVAQHVV